MFKMKVYVLVKYVDYEPSEVLGVLNPDKIRESKIDSLLMKSSGYVINKEQMMELFYNKRVDMGWGSFVLEEFEVE
jgi:hypothetical protein